MVREVGGGIDIARQPKHLRDPIEPPKRRMRLRQDIERAGLRRLAALRHREIGAQPSREDRTIGGL